MSLALVEPSVPSVAQGSEEPFILGFPGAGPCVEQVSACPRHANPQVHVRLRVTLEHDAELQNLGAALSLRIC